jgi:predicted Zn-dependent protease
VSGPADLADRARTALEHGRLDDAAAAVDVLLATRPDDPDAWMLRGVLDLQRGAAAAAAESFAHAERHGADRRKVRLGAGMAALGLGDGERAWALFTDVAGDDEDDPEAMHWLLCAGTALERWDALAERLDRFVSRNPTQHAVRFALGAVCLRLGARDRAREHYEALRLAAPGLEGLDDLRSALER